MIHIRKEGDAPKWGINVTFVKLERMMFWFSIGFAWASMNGDSHFANYRYVSYYSGPFWKRGYFRLIHCTFEDRLWHKLYLENWQAIMDEDELVSRGV